MILLRIILLAFGLLAANAAVALESGFRGELLNGKFPSCQQAKAFFARAGVLTFQQKKIYATSICSLVAKGTWAKLDALYILAAPTRAASLLNLVQNKYNLTVNGTMTFGPNAGWIGDGATGYFATGFIPSTAGGHYALGSASLGVGITNPRQNSQQWIQIGAINAAFTVFDQIAIGESGNNFNFSDVTVNVGTPLTANGAWIGTYNGTTVTGYLNGSSVGTAAGAHVAVPDTQIIIGAIGGSGFTSNYVGDSLSWALIGGGLTQADVTALYNAFSVFPTTNVPVVAVANGFTTNKFSYNFAVQGLSGIDVNATLNPGYSIYTAYWLGSRSSSFFNGAAPSAASFSFSGGAVNGGLGASNPTAAVMSTRGNTSSAFTATIAGTTMTVSSALYGPIIAGQVLVGSASLSGQTIVSQLTGTGGATCPDVTCTGLVGSYQISASATIGSSTNLLGNSATAGVAPLFTAGGYYELTMSFTTPGSPSGVPAFWLMDLNCLFDQNLNTGYGAANPHCIEFDMFEGPTFSDANVIDWTMANGVANGTSNRVNQAYPSITNPAAAHLYGMLWTPSTQNAGTGLIQFYLDQTHIAGMDVTYTSGGGASPACTPSNPNGCLFAAESGNFVLLMQSGAAGYPVAFKNVNVWH